MWTDDFTDNGFHPDQLFSVPKMGCVFFPRLSLIWNQNLRILSTILVQWNSEKGAFWFVRKSLFYGECIRSEELYIHTTNSTESIWIDRDFPPSSFLWIAAPSKQLFTWNYTLSDDLIRLKTWLLFYNSKSKKFVWKNISLNF